MITALIGGNGSIGKRYQAILHHLKMPYRVIDPIVTPESLNGITRAIISTPTNTHCEVASLCQERGIPFLCEKPLSKDLEELKKFKNFYTLGFVVNNYAFLRDFSKKKIKQIEYDFFNTGRDGLLWDVCQMVYLSEIHKSDLVVKRKSWTWKLFINSERIQYEEIEKSYVDMIDAFLKNRVDDLWSLEDGIEMSKLILKLEGSLRKELTDEGFCRNSGSQRLEALT